MALLEIVAFGGIGLAAGLIGGLLGIGGSTVFIPAATLLIGPDQQIYQAAAMVLNVFVAGTATLTHHRAGAIDRGLVLRMLPAAVVMVLLGVLASNHLDAEILAGVFGGFLILMSGLEAFRLLRSRTETDPDPSTTEQADAGPPPRLILAGIGGFMGFLGGLLGIGGGLVAVPGLRFLAKVPLRTAIVASAAVTLPMALMGAIYKNLSLSELVDAEGRSLSATDSLLIAAAIVPAAVLGSWLGARLVRRLPITTIRIAFILLMGFAGILMIGSI
ncbi:MAG: sulfite exporter TauE/SafE family protein [Phycisphaeraceae bacterium]|nr:sulfite exporter TauE/SafE family protein [Phycisphaeraceae bacterium]